MKHLTSIQLCAFLDDALVGSPDDQSARHIATCAMCRTRYEAWCHVDDSLRELLGQFPDEHAMEERTAWVEIAVSAERKGLPAPEFAELRIPLEGPPAAAPPATYMLPSADPRSHHLPPPRPAATPAPAPPPRSPLMRPVLQVQAPSPPAVAPAPQQAASAARGSRTPEHDASLRAAHAVAAGSALAGPAADARSQGYARRPRRPRKGFAGFVSRPVVWLTLLLAAALATGLPLGVARFGIPVIKFDLRPPKDRASRESEVRKAAADAGTDGTGEDAAVRKRASGSRSGSRAKAAPEDPGQPPDASIIFDLPALEPEDAEPDPEPPATQRPATPAERDADGDARGDTAPKICGEVRTSKGTPIEGARVYLSVPSRMVRTDRRGRFCIACPPGKRTLRIESAGRAPVSRTLQLGRGRLDTRFTLDTSN